MMLFQIKSELWFYELVSERFVYSLLVSKVFCSREVCSLCRTIKRFELAVAAAKDESEISLEICNRWTIPIVSYT